MAGYAVVGHVEWVDFLRVPHLPRPGEIVQATEAWEEAAGGGAVAAVQLAKLAGAATFFTALGNDEHGRRSEAELTGHGVEVHAAMRNRPQRRAIAFVDATGERTITTLGERLAPNGADELRWERLSQMDGVYFTGGDVAALQAARAAKVLVATPRAGDALTAGGVTIDALVHSANDEGESPASPAHLTVSTHGPAGGTYVDRDGRTGSYDAAPLPAAVVDAYGAGDSFVAGLTFALGSGMDVDRALALAARCGAGNLTASGPYAGQPTAADLGLL